MKLTFNNQKTLSFLIHSYELSFSTVQLLFNIMKFESCPIFLVIFLLYYKRINMEDEEEKLNYTKSRNETANEDSMASN